MNLDKFSLVQVSEESLKKFDIQVKDKRELIARVNETIFNRWAPTSKDKFEVLDLRDKVLKLIRYEISSQNSTESVILIGSCLDMCPEKERYSREFLNLTSKYETFDDQIDYRLMIKEYSRSSADQDLPLPNELRPINTLFETMLYIIDEIVSKIALDSEFLDESSIGDWYDFAWNRTRAIRKEIIQQRLLTNDHKLQDIDYSNQNELIQNGLGGVNIIEQCARFHIFCSYRLSDQGPKVFSFKINEDNLKNCFQSLRQYYESSMKSSDCSGLTPSPNETEFRSYIILLNLTQSDILSEILHWSSSIRNSPPVKFALAIYNAFNSKNYVRFFRLLKTSECTYLQACIIHRYICKMRCEAFKIIFSAFKDQKEKAYPLSKLADLLGFDAPDDVYDYCDVFELESDETNIIMKSNMPYSCFDMSKSNEDRLKVRRSKLLVESKFKQNSMLTNEKCLSQIIRGNYTRPSCYGTKSNSTHVLTTSFDENGYCCCTEINDLLEQVRPKSETIGKSILTPSKIAIKSASKLAAKAKLKNAINLRTKSVTNGESEAFPKRKSSVSSSSSISPDESKKKSSESGNKFSDLLKSKRPSGPAGVFGAAINQVKETSFFTATKKAEVSKTNPFTAFAEKSENIATNIPKPVFWQSAKQTTAIETDKEPKKNLFEFLIKKNDQQDIAERKEKQLNLKTESYFQSLHLELIKEVVNEFYQVQQLTRHIPTDLANNIMDDVVDSMIKSVVYKDIVPMVKQAEQVEIMKRKIEKQKKEESLIRYQQENLILNEIYESLVSSIVKSECTDFLKIRKESELTIYDDLLCSVFQNEFDIILKQIAQELSNELIIDRLTKAIYFNNESNFENQLDLLAHDKNIDYTSIFMTDLCLLLHDCIYECTRLNLNVNRELYYELKHALILNEKKHLFRKWRLRLSLKLLKSMHKRKNLDQQKRHTTPTRNDSSTNLVDRQLNLITFVKTYGTYLLNNLNRLQKVLTFMICEESNEDQECKQNQSITSQHSIVHCEEYQMHLTWNIAINYRHFLYEILLENYFDIIHNRDDQVLMPANMNHELFAKIVISLPKLNSENEDKEAIKRWLMMKFFQPGQTSHIENLCVTMLHSNTYGLKFNSKLCTTNQSQYEFECKLKKREFYGANALVFALMPCDEDLHTYSKRMKREFFQVLKLFNENLDFNSTSVVEAYRFMFISYLDGDKETRSVIDFILGKSDCCYCLLEGEVTSDNALLQQTYQYFIKKVYTQASKDSLNNQEMSSLSRAVNNYEPVNNVMTLTNIFEMTIMKLFEYLTHSNKSLYVPFNAMIDEYNTRLDMLIKILTRDEYRQLAWPIPELCETDLNSTNWNLRYWNTNECFDNVIRGQFYNLMYLNEDLSLSDEIHVEEEDIQIEFSIIEIKFKKYLERIISSKRTANLLPPPQSECIKSRFRFESSINNTIINMKKLTVNNTISKSEIKWSQLLLATIEYLLANGYLHFQNTAPTTLDQFYFYCNLNELKSHDWINNIQVGNSSLSSSPSSSVFSNNSLNQSHSLNKPKSHQLAVKYARKIDSSNKKRRISDEELNENDINTVSPPINQASLEETYNLGEMFLNNFDKKPKTQRLMTSESIESEKLSFGAGDKFQEFLSALNKEKDSYQKFESKLVIYNESKMEEERNDMLSISFDYLEGKKKRDFFVNSKKNLEYDKNINKTFEDFLEQLNEEKKKNEKFNSKLEEMLNY